VTADGGDPGARGEEPALGHPRRGAAPRAECAAGDHELTRLICDGPTASSRCSTHGAFSDARPIERSPVNIHEVLERVRKVAKTGFSAFASGRGVRSSLPAVLGNHDLLVQVFLNLVKNAAEAAPAHGGEIGPIDSYQHGVRLALPGATAHAPAARRRDHDNGDGIPRSSPASLRSFVTTKRNGTGLGLALVAKVIGDHGGVIDFDSQKRRTVFRVFLPMADGPRRSEAAD